MTGARDFWLWPSSGHPSLLPSQRADSTSVAPHHAGQSAETVHTLHPTSPLMPRRLPRRGGRLSALRARVDFLISSRSVPLGTAQSRLERTKVGPLCSRDGLGMLCGDSGEPNWLYGVACAELVRIKSLSDRRKNLERNGERGSRRAAAFVNAAVRGTLLRSPTTSKSYTSEVC